MAKVPFILNPALVAIAVDYGAVNRATRGYIADMVAPIVRVDTPDFRYPQFDLESVFDVVDNQVDRLGRLNEIYSSAGQATGSTLDYGLAEPIPYRDEMASQNQQLPFNLKARAVRHVVDKNQLAREVRVAAMIQSAANYGAQTADRTGASLVANAVDTAGIIETAAESMLLAPNVAVMSRKVRNALRRSTALQTTVGGTQVSGRVLTDQDVADALNVDRIIVGNTLKQTSKRGQTVATGQIWGDHLALLRVADGMAGPGSDVDDVNVPSFALTFQWGDEVSGETPDPDMGLWGGVRVRSGRSLVEKVVAPFGGYLFRNVLG